MRFFKKLVHLLIMVALVGVEPARLYGTTVPVFSPAYSSHFREQALIEQTVSASWRALKTSLNLFDQLGTSWTFRHVVRRPSVRSLILTTAIGGALFAPGLFGVAAQPREEPYGAQAYQSPESPDGSGLGQDVGSDYGYVPWVGGGLLLLLLLRKLSGRTLKGMGTIAEKGYDIFDTSNFAVNRYGKSLRAAYSDVFTRSGQKVGVGYRTTVYQGGKRGVNDVFLDSATQAAVLEWANSVLKKLQNEFPDERLYIQSIALGMGWTVGREGSKAHYDNQGTYFHATLTLDGGAPTYLFQNPRRNFKQVFLSDADAGKPTIAGYGKTVVISGADRTRAMGVKPSIHSSPTRPRGDPSKRTTLFLSIGSSRSFDELNRSIRWERWLQTLSDKAGFGFTQNTVTVLRKLFVPFEEQMIFGLLGWMAHVDSTAWLSPVIIATYILKFALGHRGARTFKAQAGLFGLLSTLSYSVGLNALPILLIYGLVTGIHIAWNMIDHVVPAVLDDSVRHKQALLRYSKAA